MFLPFEKWQGCRNDFIVTWLSPTDDLVLDSLKRQAARICLRDGSGIGADGIIILHKSTANDLLPGKLTVVNSDGSSAKTCGNGIRCAALSVLKKNRAEGRKGEVPEVVEFDLGDNHVICSFMGKKNVAIQARRFPLVAVEMGIPLLDDDTPFHIHSLSEASRILGKIDGELHSCRIGNDHIVFLTNGQATRADLLKFGPQFQKSEHWDGINFHLVSAAELSESVRKHAVEELGDTLEELYTALPWERGAGETAACGSGACAIGAAIISTGLVDRSSWIGIEMPGGRLYVRQISKDEPIVLAGPGEFVFEGTIEL